MTKVGIMSMQRIKNYGSFLQAYALKKMVESLGCDVEFVDYHVGIPLINENNKKNTFSKGLGALKGRAKLKHKIQYVIHKRNFGKKYFPILNLTNIPNYNPTLDTLIIGSDEVFNCVQGNKNVGYSLELFGKNNNSKKLITYAASFGNTTMEKITEFNKNSELSILLKDFDYISVRDNNSYDIIYKLTNIKPIINLDPVLAYDYVNDCKEIPKICTKEKYMILYAYNGRISMAEAKAIKEYCKNINVKIYSIGGAQPFADKFIDCSPFEVLAYFKNAEFIITDTFHGSIFSIIYNKPFCTLIRKSVDNKYGNEEKLFDLLKRLNLKDRAFYHIDELIKNINKEIDYTNTNTILEDERNKTITYLKENIFQVQQKSINVNKKNCCGCGACEKICPKNAIKLEEDENGFYYPKVDYDKCINCGLCEKFCNYRHGIINNENIKAYAGMNKNINLLKSSASGGIFSGIALNFIKNNGVVYGASLLLNDDLFEVKHIRIDSEQNIKKIQGSKYIQSHANEVFPFVLDDLKDGKNVLFTGTPCQIHGLYAFLKNTEYPNLYTIDIICHGVPNIKMFNDYIKTLEKKYNKKIIDFSFRDKTKGYGLNAKITFSDGTYKLLRSYQSSFYQLFLDSNTYRENCYSCPYAKKERCADLTIGDYWGIKEEHGEYLDNNFNEKNGISCILVNTAKGKDIIKKYGDNIDLKNSNEKSISKHNHQLRHPSKLTEDRKKILNLYKNKGYEEVDKYYKKKNFIKNTIKNVIKK